MNALLHAELIKLRTTRTFAVVVATAAVFSLVLAALGAVFQDDLTPRELFTNSSITYIIVLLGAIAMSGEWRHRTITGSVLAAPNRARLLVAKAMSYSVAGVVLSVLVTVATVAVGTLVLEIRDRPTLDAGGVADVLWRNMAVAALLGPLGVAVGALVRNQVVTVVGLIAVAAALEPAVVGASPAVGKFGPLAEVPAGILGGAGADQLLAPGAALAALVAWTGVAFAAAAWRLRHRDLV